MRRFHKNIHGQNLKRLLPLKLRSEELAMSKKERKPLSERDEARPTEDDLARAGLGGPKGSSKLPPAPLTRREREQILPNDEPGHVA
jgi:hypothetical protein